MTARPALRAHRLVFCGPNAPAVVREAEEDWAAEAIALGNKFPAGRVLAK